jgi:hypothetical protein
VRRLFVDARRVNEDQLIHRRGEDGGDAVRVVCDLDETMDTFCPTSALTRVDFPTQGRPMTATNPDWWPSGSGASRQSAASSPFRNDFAPRFGQKRLNHRYRIRQSGFFLLKSAQSPHHSRFAIR